MLDKLNIKISLANRLYPMNINPHEEKMIRVSASKIDKMLKKLKEKYSVKDDQDLLAMCALQLCIRLERATFQKKEVEQKIVDDILSMKKSISDIM
ncbi:MAG: cell division protein ZapA [Flavobacteriales bacterium]|nr:cell division protein ZapA [Flavobacteriales bacterium]